MYVETRIIQFYNAVLVVGQRRGTVDAVDRKFYGWYDDAGINNRFCVTNEREGGRPDQTADKSFSIN